MTIDSENILNSILSSLERIDYIKPTEIPNIDLYMDQVTTFMEEHLQSSKRYPDDKILTKTMINNYVKLRFIKPPVRRKYDRVTVASLFVIAILKPVYSIEEIGYLIRLSLGHSDSEAAYDGFCENAEAAVSHAFHRTTMEKTENQNDPRQLLWNACNAFACQLYVRRTYLEDAIRTAEEESRV